ncbi:hypothetical protein HFO94_07690 [Rhizobium leguminosarum]|uniref:hypothetical protein n=1 Tax=Rhizobium TaxID=379 RepID=UPI00147812CC|nr:MULTISPECIES: hypothetical protein [Rhizobium]MBY5353422.1 hypothetical protein [Rhizobium leguminosarum]NNH41549.1 hypothetical protein [Rhizobium laguerreae]
MVDSELREPQTELFFQAYLLGITVGHLPFFFGDLAMGTLIAKFIFSLPFIFILFISYRIKYIEMNSRPCFWAFIVFIGTLSLIAAVFLSLSGFGEKELVFLLFVLAYCLPSVLVACIAFPIMLRLRVRRNQLINNNSEVC